MLNNGVSIVDGIQYWTVPVTGEYLIDAKGADGGNDLNGTATGGQGAHMRGKFFFIEGDVLKLLVGQAGESNYTSTGGGG